MRFLTISLIFSVTATAHASSTCVSSTLLSAVKGYAAETHNGTDHVRKWEQVLVAFEALNRPNLLPYTSKEAADQANRWGTTRWLPVVNALSCIESADFVDVQTYADGCTNNVLLGSALKKSLEANNGNAHRQRWNRVLGTLTNGNYGHGQMTASEAEGHANQYGGLWNLVEDSLKCIENPPSVEQVTPQVETQAQQQTPSVKSQVEGYADGCASGSLLGKIYDYSQETGKGEVHVGRWNQVLAAFTDGEFGEDEDPMSASEAQGYANRGWSRWVPVAQALQCAEGPSSARDPPQTETEQSETPQTEAQQSETQQVQRLRWKGGSCRSKTNNNRAKFTQEEDGTIVFEVEEWDSYECELQGVFADPYGGGTHHFTGIRGITRHRFSPRLKGTRAPRSIVLYYNGNSDDDSEYTGDRESNVIDVDGQKFKLVIKEDDVVPEPRLGSGCTSGAWKITLAKEGNTYVVRVPEKGNFTCTIENLTKVYYNNSPRYSLSVTGINPPQNSDRFNIQLNGSNRDVVFYFNNNDDDQYTGDRSTNVLNIRSREVEFIVVDDEPPGGNPSWNTACTSSTSNGAANAAITKRGSVWEIKVAEEGEYYCDIDDIVGAGHDGYYFFSNLAGVPENQQHQYLYVKGTTAKFRFRNNDDALGTGSENRASSPSVGANSHWWWWTTNSPPLAQTPAGKPVPGVRPLQGTRPRQ